MITDRISQGGCGRESWRTTLSDERISVKGKTTGRRERADKQCAYKGWARPGHCGNPCQIGPYQRREKGLDTANRNSFEIKSKKRVFQISKFKIII